MKKPQKFAARALRNASTAAAIAYRYPSRLRESGSKRPVSQPSIDKELLFGKFDSLASLVIERLLLSDQVAASKYGTDSGIDDPVREQRLLESVELQAAAFRIDPGATADFFYDQIVASKVVQRGLFARWAAHPAEAPTDPPDLKVIRLELDRITTALLHELKATQGRRGSVRFCRLRLLLVSQSGGPLMRLDKLHRQALGDATKSLRARNRNLYKCPRRA